MCYIPYLFGCKPFLYYTLYTFIMLYSFFFFFLQEHGQAVQLICMQNKQPHQFSSQACRYLTTFVRADSNYWMIWTSTGCRLNLRRVSSPVPKAAKLHEQTRKGQVPQHSNGIHRAFRSLSLRYSCRSPPSFSEPLPPPFYHSPAFLLQSLPPSILSFPPFLSLIVPVSLPPQEDSADSARRARKPGLLTSSRSIWPNQQTEQPASPTLARQLESRAAAGAGGLGRLGPQAAGRGSRAAAAAVAAGAASQWLHKLLTRLYGATATRLLSSLQLVAAWALDVALFQAFRPDPLLRGIGRPAPARNRCGQGEGWAGGWGSGWEWRAGVGKGRLSIAEEVRGDVWGLQTGAVDIMIGQGAHRDGLAGSTLASETNEVSAV